MSARDSADRRGSGAGVAGACGAMHGRAALGLSATLRLVPDGTTVGIDVKLRRGVG